MQHPLPKTLFPFIWHFLRDYKEVVIAFVSLALIAGFWGPLNSMLVKHVINLLPEVKNGDVSILMVPAGLIVLNFIVMDNCTWRGIDYLDTQFTPIIINRMMGECLTVALEHGHQFYQDNLSGKISKQIGNLSDGVDKLLGHVAAIFLRALSLLIVSFITAYFVNPIFSLILVVWLLLFLGVGLRMSKKLVMLSDHQASAESVVMGELVDTLSNHSAVRSFSRKSYEHFRMLPFFKKQQIACTKNYFYLLYTNLVQGGLIAIMMAFSAYFLVHLYGKNLITVGDFALIFGLTMETGHLMWFTMSVVGDFNQAIGRCKQSLMAIMLPFEIQDKPEATLLQCDRGHIRFQNVKFHYKGAEPLFQNKSIDIQAGQKVGLVGYSGGGKSTFVNLILRFYDITDGAILIDGQDIRDVTQDSLRANIAMIPQDSSLFQRTLMENIRYGRIDATDEEVIEASKKAYADEFINQLEQGYEQLVGERGVKLSGGQRQRIAIARAILKNAPILILDEATSQLDSITESFIQKSLNELMQNKTTIVIAHRLSTLLHMDRILVFDKGKIVQDGTHDELLTKDGLYKHLWNAQVGGFLGDEERNPQ